MLHLLRHSLTTRLLFTCISAHLYNKDESLDGLLAELAQQGQELFEHGIQACLAFDFRHARESMTCLPVHCGHAGSRQYLSPHLAWGKGGLGLS